MMIAYIDPGSGAILLQWIIAGIIGVGIFFRTTIVGFLRKLFGRKQDHDSKPEKTQNGE